MRYLGIDFGTKRIGLALGDDIVKMASPFGVADNLEAVVKIIQDEEVDEIVVGIPFSMKTVDGEMEAMVKRFIVELKSKTNLPIFEIDERLSSKGADALVGDKKTKAPRDAIAAMIILQSYLDQAWKRQ